MKEMLNIGGKVSIDVGTMGSVLPLANVALACAKFLFIIHWLDFHHLLHPIYWKREKTFQHAELELC